MNFFLYKGSFIWKQEFHLSSLFLEDNFARRTTRHWRIYPWVWWNQLTLAHKDLLHTSLPNSAFGDVTRIVWNQPSWECLLHGAQKFCKSGLPLLLDMQVKPSAAQHWALPSSDMAIEKLAVSLSCLWKCSDHHHSQHPKPTFKVISFNLVFGSLITMCLIVDFFLIVLFDMFMFPAFIH